MRRFVRVIGLIAVVLSSMAIVTSALAASGNGQGQTPLSAALGFNAKDDLSGQLDYVADPAGIYAGFKAHCDGYTSFRLSFTHAGYPHIVVSATCTDQDGATVYLRFGMTDRGEPGTRDTICVLWGYSLPLTHDNAYIHDHGFISNGNIQTHTDPLTGQWIGEMLSA
jgi:hypothetical protein